GQDRFNNVSLTRTGTPIIYKIANKDCQNYGAEGFSSNLLESSFFNQGINGYFDLYFGDDELAISMKASYVSKERPLNICDQDSIDKDTVEGVLLEMATHIDTAATFYQSLANKVELNKYAINIHPLEKSIIRFDASQAVKDELAKSEDFDQEIPFGVESYATDNASWSYDGDDQFIFTIYPRSEEARDANISKPLWESKWVLAHEFCHHVFYGHMKDVFGDVDESNLPEGIPLPESSMSEGFYRYYGKSQQKMISLLKSRNGISAATATSSLAAINEGFADICGSYFSGLDKFEEGLACFEKDRDIRSSEFRDGIKKQLTAEALIDFANQETEIKDSDNQTCGGYTYSDPHIIGAIIANGAHSLIDLKQIDRVKKSEILLTWLNTFKNEFQQGEWGSISVIRASLVSLINTIAAYGREDGKAKLSTEECKAIKYSFPKFYDDWKSDKSSLPVVATSCL
ncbi:MAG: hypothetical protein R3B45_17510, partial [Bdellovibrionota bacterium]